MVAKTNIWAELNEIELIATRHKRASSLKRLLLTDLEMIQDRIDDFRKLFANEVETATQEEKNLNEAPVKKLD